MSEFGDKQDKMVFLDWRSFIIESEEAGLLFVAGGGLLNGICCECSESAGGTFNLYVDSVDVEKSKTAIPSALG